MSIALMTAVWRLDLPCTEKMVLLALADAANDDGVTWIALKSRREGKLDLLTKCSLSERAIQYSIKTLCEAGYLSREERAGRGVIYTVTPAPDAPRTTCTPAPRAPDPRTTCTQTVINRHISSSSSSSSPRARAPSFDQTEWGERFEQAKEAAGDAADLTRPAMLHCRDLRALVEPSSGEPCDWDEVLDAIRMVAARQRTRGKLITTWAWVRDDAIALRDKRLSGNPEPQTHAPHAKPTSLADELATQKANARRRVLEMTEGRDNDQSC